jgi:hypothetical protein
MMCISNPAQSRYRVRMIVAALLCIVFSLAATLGIRNAHLTGFLAYLLAILPALPIAGSLVATGAYLNEEKDEFQKNVYIQSLLGGIAVTLAMTTVWGYLEGFALVPHVSLVWVFPLFWILASASYPVFWLRYR